MRVIVCGGRDYTKRERVFEFLDEFHAKTPITLLIAGGAPGADTFAEHWAIARGVPYHVEHAKWKEHGRAAGPRRNVVMADMGPDHVIAFPGGRGTGHMVRITQVRSVPHTLVDQAEWKQFPWR